MSNEPVNQPGSQTHVDELNERLTRALEAVPAPRIPSDFAARVASQMPARRPVSLTPTRYGQTMMLISAVVLLAVILALAADRGAQTAVGLTMEWLLCAQFIVFTSWLSIRYRGAR